MKIIKLIKKSITKKRAMFLCAAVLACAALTFARPYLIEIISPDTVATAAATKKLPIYCVDTGTSKKVAISFDAAWGAY